MTNPVIACFSDNNDNLKLICYEFHKYYGSVINQTIFREEQSLLDSIKNHNFSRQEPQLITIDVNNSNTETVRFINNISEFCPSAVKLIIAKRNHVEQIKRFAEKNDSVLFLNSPWDSKEMNLALNMASQTNPNLNISNKSGLNKRNFNEHVEDKVNQKLQKLNDSNLAKDSFLSIIAHDLKSPFVALQGISEILLNDWETLSDKTKLELVGDLHKTSEDTYKLLESLLEWARLKNEKLDADINEVQIHDLVDSTLKVSQNNALLKGIEIQNNIDNHIKVYTDKNMIAAVFRNLISNAVQYTQPGGKININAKVEKNFCEFCVADTGSGIDKPHILEFFSRGNRKKINGNANAFKGLGLIICKDFVEKNGGEIWLETKKGLGSKFFFTIPC